MTTQALTVYRQSALADSDCLFRFNEIHRKGVDDSGDYALRGQAFAHWKHLYILRLVEKGLPADAEEAMAAFVEAIATHQTPQRLIPELRELCFRHAEVFTLDLEHYVTSEERTEGDGVTWAADLIYARPAGLEIVDDKSYWVCLTEEEVRQTYQARFYAWRAMRKYPNFPEYRVTFVFVRFNRVASVVFTPAEIDAMELEVRADIARIREAERINQWPAVVGPSCRFCELKCPVADRQMMMPVRLNAEQAQGAGEWLIPAEKAIKSIKKALKAYVAANGPIDVNGVEWANRPVLERKYPIQDLMAILQKRNLMGAFDAPDVKGSMTISHSALAKLFRQFPMLLDDLAGCVQEKTSYRFSAKKPGADEEGEAE